MPTDFMNRRMDLIHTTSNVAGIGDVNYLTMDTSYPVKLAGKVMKIFKAGDVYNKGRWVLVNAADEGILTITNSNVYDFGGNVIKNCVGEERLYPTEQDVFCANDYVVVIIDFDNESMRLCSQKMFEHIYNNTGTSDVNLKMFDISGDDVVPGIDEPVSQEELDKAVSFETGDGTFALVRRSNSDKVVFQATEQDEDGNYRYVPVSDVDNKNINGFNVSALSLLYPSINTGYTNSFFGCNALKSMLQLNGKVNEKFIQDFCYSYAEIQDLLVGPGALLDQYAKYYYNNIPDAEKDNYYYYIRDNSSDNNYSPIIKDKRQSQMIIPILKETLKFSTVDFSGPGVQTRNLELNMMNSQLSGNMIGNWWSSGFDPTKDGTGSIWSKPQTVKYSEDNSGSPTAYAFDISNISSKFGRSFYLTEYITSAPIILADGDTYYTDMDSQYPNIDKEQVYLITAPENGDLYLYGATDMSYYTESFMNDDEDYKYYIRYSPIRGAYQDGCYVFNSANHFRITTSFPVNVAMICNEYISGRIFNHQTLWDLCDDDNLEKERVCYNVRNEDTTSEAYYILYLMSFYPKGDINDFRNKLNYLKDQQNNIKNSGNPEDKFVFKVSNDFLLRSGNDVNSPFGICTHKTAGNDTINYLVYHFTKMMPKAIAAVQKEDKERYIADMSFITKAYAIEIKLAKADFDDHLEYINENGTYYLKHVEHTSLIDIVTSLYLTKYSNGSLTLVKASYAEVASALDYNGTVFLYMGSGGKDIDDQDNENVYRLRYYTDFTTIDEYSTHGSDPNDAFTDLDFFTVPERVCYKNTDASFGNLYDRAYAATRNDITSSGALVTAVQNTPLSDRIIQVEYEYALYKNGNTYGIMNKIDAETNIPTVVYKRHPIVNISSNTITLALFGEDHIRDYRRSADTTLMDILPSGCIPYTNGPAPALSRIKDKNGSFIINSASYIDFISNVLVSKTTENIPNNITGNDPIPPMLAEEQLRYVNGVGVKEEYYQNKTIFEFLNNLTMYDITKSSELQRQDDIKVDKHPVYEKGAFDSISSTTQYTDFKDKFIYGSQERFVDNAEFKIPSGTSLNAYSSSSAASPSETIQGDGQRWQVVSATPTNGRVQIRLTNTSTTYWVKFSDIAYTYTGFQDASYNQIKLNAPISIVSKINFRSNKYGFNEAFIYAGTAQETEDRTNYYISIDKIFASTEKAGEKQVTNVSLCDENGIPLNLNGILGTIDVDTINWDALMTALSSNKTIDILSILKDIKVGLNQDVVTATQNISDTISDANNIDNVSNIGIKADFDSDTNLYTYHDGEGYDDDVKEMNNRGVIVLVSEGGKTTMVNGVPVTTNSTIHVKRMYISKDGLLCTKEFYDAEKAIGKSLLERLHDLDHLGD